MWALLFGGLMALISWLAVGAVGTVVRDWRQAP